jgi:hypothetical protein
MPRTRTLVAALGALAAIAGGISTAGPAIAAPQPAMTAPPSAMADLPGSVAPFAMHAQATGDAGGSSRLTIQVWLRPRNPAICKLAGTSALFGPVALIPHSPVSWRALVCPASLCGNDEPIATDGQGHPPFIGYTGQVTRRGYDNVTGLGSPNGRHCSGAATSIWSVRNERPQSFLDRK